MPKLSENTKSVLYVAVSLSIVGGAFYYASKHPEVARSERTQCAPTLENGHTIVVVDKTDPWNASQAQRLEDHILWLVSQRMKTEERLSIFSFGAEFETGFAPMFFLQATKRSRCR